VKKSLCAWQGVAGKGDLSEPEWLLAGSEVPLQHSAPASSCPGPRHVPSIREGCCRLEGREVGAGQELRLSAPKRTWPPARLWSSLQRKHSGVSYFAAPRTAEQDVGRRPWHPDARPWAAGTPRAAGQLPGCPGQTPCSPPSSDPQPSARSARRGTAAACLAVATRLCPPYHGHSPLRGCPQPRRPGGPRPRCAAVCGQGRLLRARQGPVGKRHRSVARRAERAAPQCPDNTALCPAGPGAGR